MPSTLRQILTRKNLLAAYDKVLGNHGAPGVDAVSIQDWGVQLNANIAALQGAVLRGKCLNDKVALEDFETTNMACTISTKTLRWFVREIELKLNTEMQHPSPSQSGEMLDMRRIMDWQIRALLAAYRAQDAALFSAVVFR